MLSKRSIRREYVKQLLFSSLALIAIFSLILYGYIKSSIYDELKEELKKEVHSIATSKSDYKIGQTVNAYSISSIKGGELTISIVPNPGEETGIFFREAEKNGKAYLSIYRPYNMEDDSYIHVRKDVTTIEKLLDKIFSSILIINFGGLVLVQIYAFTLSNILTKPIMSLSNKLSKMNENVLEPLDHKKLPIEFQPLGNSVNELIMKLKNYLLYQKELFIGIAHELKTPLAVMKLKNEVLLIKEREIDRYKEAIELNINSINEMNKMVQTVLEIGRQEGAQFETPKEIDVVEYLNRIGKDFMLLAREGNKNLVADLNPDTLQLYLQPTLLRQVIQNFLQNALKFTPSGKGVYFISHLNGKKYHIEVIDEGPGIDGDLDIYAPFKRSGKESGAGLGLFLAKSAASAMGAKINLVNRSDGQGAVASLELDVKKCQKRENPSRKRKSRKT